MRPEHDHLLDGRLHDAAGCPMCAEIRQRMARAAIDAAAERALEEYAERARRRMRPPPDELP